MKKFLTLLSTLMILMAALQPLGVEKYASAQTIEAMMHGPAWYDPAWHYRRPVTVSNIGAAIATSYQVLVKLDSSNFDFTKAKSDLSDLPRDCW